MDPITVVAYVGLVLAIGALAVVTTTLIVIGRRGTGRHLLGDEPGAVPADRRDGSEEQATPIEIERFPFPALKVKDIERTRIPILIDGVELPHVER